MGNTKKVCGGCAINHVFFDTYFIFQNPNCFRFRINSRSLRLTGDFQLSRGKKIRSITDAPISPVRRLFDIKNTLHDCRVHVRVWRINSIDRHVSLVDRKTD